MAVAEKRPLDENVFSSKHIIMDIEGTTTSISFVKDTLFPYVRQNLDLYFKTHWDEEDFKTTLALLKDQAAEDKKADMEGAVEIPSDGSEDDLKAAVAKYVLWQMGSDRKTTALKKLQGQMWQQGYKSGELKGHLFADVAPALKEWVKDGRKLYVYSSGSVQAQKLLFGYSTEGDLTELFTGFFDTEVGAKIDAGSYKSIVKKLDCNADDVLFLTDLPKEASAAREAGLPVILVEREGNEPIASDLRKEFSAVSSFGQVAFEATTKKQKVDKDVKEEVKPAEDKDTSMDVDAVEEPKAKVVESEVQAEAMDVDKKQEESAKEDNAKSSADTEASLVKSKENVGAEKSNSEKSEVSNGEAVVKSQENGTVEKSVSKDKSEVTIVEKDNKSQIEETKDTSTAEAAEIVNAKTSHAAETNEKPKEGVTVTEKEEVSERTEVLEKKTEVLEQKTEVHEQKTENKNIEKMETESDKVQPKEDPKTEEKEINQPDTAVESPATDVCELKEKVEESIKDGKPDQKETATEVKEAQKEAVPEIKVDKEETTEVKEGETVQAKEEVEVAETKSAAEIDVSKKSTETDKSKSENAEEKKDKVEAEEMNGGKDKAETEEKEKLNGVSNGNKDAATNGTVANGHSKEKDGIPEVIVSKNPPQIENGDAGVALEA